MTDPDQTTEPDPADVPVEADETEFIEKGYAQRLCGGTRCLEPCPGCQDCNPMFPTPALDPELEGIPRERKPRWTWLMPTPFQQRLVIASATAAAVAFFLTIVILCVLMVVTVSS